MNIPELAGIVINQNATATGFYPWTTSIYQTFTLPDDYQRGQTGDPNAIIPPLSGLHVFLRGGSDASLSYTLEYLTSGTWVTLDSGTASGLADVNGSWLYIDFTDAITVTADMLDATFRFSLSSPSDIIGAGYTSPTPLTQASISVGQTYRSDGVTPIVSPSASLNFRVLALVADEGTDFLGNAMNAAVITTDESNVLANDSSFWMSPALPSPFAVHSMYFDVRPNEILPTQQLSNLVPDPSFEYDALGTHPPTSLWSSLFSNASQVTNAVQNTWAMNGQNAWRLTSGAATSGGYVYASIATPVPVQANQAYAMVASAHFDAAHTGTVWEITINWFDVNNNLIRIDYPAGQSTPAVVGQTSTITGTVNAPANAVTATCGAMALVTTGQVVDWAIDAIAFAPGTTITYNDGDLPGYQWTGQAGYSSSVQLIELNAGSDTVVIDGVVLDMITPDHIFNVYYSIDDAYTSDTMSDTDWEQKMWSRVPRVFQYTTSQQYAFPEPVIAKYMKLEFTNLQAQPYDPGPFPIPVRYKKFPAWVLQHFLNQIETPSFVVDAVDVQFDALDLAYNYYLDDLQELPDLPSVPTQDAIAQLPAYFASQSTELDATTLSKINLDLQPYQRGQASLVDASTLLGQAVTGLLQPLQGQTIYTTNGLVSENSDLPPVDYTVVSSLNRSAVVFEQLIPPMYFFLTCRHAYKEVYGSFEYNRAYFCGVQSVNWVREDYSSPVDQDLYIETGGDTVNAELFEFIINDNGDWTTYPPAPDDFAQAASGSSSTTLPPGQPTPPTPPPTDTFDTIRLSPRFVD